MPIPLPRQRLARLRAALTVIFALDGFLFASWVVRIPAVQARLHADSGQLGVALLGISAGAVATMAVTGRACRRFGSRATTVGTLVLFSLGLSLPPLANSVPVLAAVLFVVGIGYGGANVAMNSAAVELLARTRRPIMPSFHAAFSIGGLLGSGLGGVLAERLGVAAHLGLATGLGVVVIAVAGRVLTGTPLPPPDERGAGRATGRARTAAADGTHRPGPDGDGAAARRGVRDRPGAPPADPGDPQAPVAPSRAPERSGTIGSTAARASAGFPAARLSSRVWPFVVLFGTVALCTAYGEGALADWGALHLRQDLHTGAGTAAVGYAAFSCAMAVGRLGGTTLLERLGQTTTVVGGGLLAAGGMLLAALAPVLPLVVLGFVIVGLGLANIFPVAIARAGVLAGPGGVAVASTLGYGGMLVGPVVIGFVAQLAGLPAALTTVAVLAALAATAAALARRGGPEGGAAQPAPPDHTRPDT